MDKKVIALMVVVGFLSTAFIWAFAENLAKDRVIGLLNEKINDLMDENIQLQVWLEENITYYESEIASLNSQISRLQKEKNQLQDWLESNITYYESEVNLLSSQKMMLEENVSQLTTMYDDLASEYQDYIAAYQSLVDEVNWRWSHNNIEAFITPEDASVKNIVQEITGGWSDPSDWSEFWSDVRAMYNWVVDNIEYRSDGLYPLLPDNPHGQIYFWNEMWQLPYETLELRKGDCEDMAILLCSMIRAYTNSTYKAEAIIIAGSDRAHVAVQLPVSGNLLTILDPAGNYYTCNSLGRMDQIDVETEINNWLEYWKPQLGRDVYVKRVFSDYMDKTFGSTDEYISWMYER